MAKNKIETYLYLCWAMPKIINNPYPFWLYSFNTVYESTACVRRQQKSLVVFFSKTCARAFAIIAPKTWNSLSFSITSTTSHKVK